ncbi:hypothetical protein FA95DRAFT_883869 [Auriscalpium vulgare]|uniref:Uncharacterized protein n=1 Tax=Auriscalpium vulgare TaxID=40419 RepID=A0ACB8R9V5_9AGAM|nr:hypothetical protein FA95DRAFT_883869 [Auriscalpium vulgare]
MLITFRVRGFGLDPINVPRALSPSSAHIPVLSSSSPLTRGSRYTTNSTPQSRHHLSISSSTACDELRVAVNILSFGSVRAASRRICSFSLRSWPMPWKCYPR